MLWKYFGFSLTVKKKKKRKLKTETKNESWNIQTKFFSSLCRAQQPQHFLILIFSSLISFCSSKQNCLDYSVIIKPNQSNIFYSVATFFWFFSCYLSRNLSERKKFMYPNIVGFWSTVISCLNKQTNSHHPAMWMCGQNIEMIWHSNK